MGYFRHLWRAWKIVFVLLVTSVILLVHSLFPDIAVDFASRTIKKINEKLNG